MNYFNLKGLFPNRILTSVKIALIFIMMSAVPTFAGNYAQDTKLTIKQSNIELDKLLKLIESQSDFSFFYSNDKINKNLKVSVDATEKTIREILTQALGSSGISFRVVDKTIVLSSGDDSQQDRRTIKGIVTDENGVVVGGAGIVEKGTNNGIVSDQNGNFAIQAGSGSVLAFSLLGYVTQEVAVGTRTELSVVLAEEAESLDDVVVIGYGSVKKKDLTGAVTSIRSEDIVKTNMPILNHILKTQMPIDVRPGGLEPGSNPLIEVRGNTALITTGDFKQSNDPLWVVDGMPMQSSSMMLNPYDIVSIDILQDASAAAIYGARGANGVIIVTTKQAQVGEEKMSVSYNGWVGFDKVTRPPELMNGEQFADYKRAANYHSGTFGEGATLENALKGDYDSRLFDSYEQDAIDKGYYTNWFDEIYGGTSFNTNHTLTVSTSGKKTGTVISLGYLNQESLVPYAGYSRYNANFSNKLKVSDRLEFNTKILGTYSKNDHAPGGVELLYQIPPLSSPYDENGDLKLMVTGGTYSYNPIMEAQNALNEIFEYNIVGSTAMKWNIWDNLNYEIAVRADYSNSDDGNYFKTLTTDRGGTKPPSAEYKKTTNLATTFDNILSYNKEFGIHRIDAMAAFNTENYSSKYLQLRTEDMTFDGLYYNMGTAATILSKDSRLTEWTIMSFMGRVNYSLLDRYIFTATFRRDGSSRLSTGNKWTQYPAFAVSWRLSEEAFMSSLKEKFLDNLKLRLSYGNSGKMNIPPYSTLGSISQSSAYPWGSTATVGTRPGTIPNTNLVWEKTTEYNLGIDFGLFKGRLTGMIDLYDKNTNGMIMGRDLPRTSGFQKFQMNIGKVNNKGIQVTLKGDIIRNKDFVWNMGIIFYKNKNAIIDLDGEKQDLPGSSWFIGQPIRVYYGYDFIGVWQEEEATEAAVYNAKPGWPKLLDVQNGTNDAGEEVKRMHADEDRVIIPTDPKWIGSLNTSVSYKGFDLYVNINTRQGARGGSAEYQGAPGPYNSIYVENWTKENRSNEHPAPWLSSTFSTGYGDYMLYDLSYIRLANISLGYTLPTSLSRKFSSNNARIFVNISNPYVYAPNYKGNDPENTNKGYPSVTSYQFGVNLSF